MYLFSKSVKTIARECVRLANDAAYICDAGEIFEVRRYAIYSQGDTERELGGLHCTIGCNDDGLAYITVNAQLTDDLGRANQVTTIANTSSDVVFAIGFTSASAFWRGPHRNDR